MLRVSSAFHGLKRLMQQHIIRVYNVQSLQFLEYPNIAMIFVVAADSDGGVIINKCRLRRLRVIQTPEFIFKQLGCLDLRAVMIIRKQIYFFMMTTGRGGSLSSSEGLDNLTKF
jgi:hypothetical protein